MVKLYPTNPWDGSICVSIDKITFLEVDKIIVDTNTGELEIFHSYSYFDKAN